MACWLCLQPIFHFLLSMPGPPFGFYEFWTSYPRPFEHVGAKFLVVSLLNNRNIDKHKATLYRGFPPPLSIHAEKYHIRRS